MTWTDISSNYEGVFFRVVGGNAGSFGAVQQEDAPRLEGVYSSKEDPFNKGKVIIDHEMTIPLTGWSQGFRTGDSYGDAVYTSFKNTYSTEVRPKNMAIKIYKRIA